jgi:LmbE family N-acetylglucosaminyl deacetylase
MVVLLAVASGLLMLLAGATDLGATDLGPLLVVVAHPDDEGLTMSGVIANARAAGRRVYVAVVTNGDYAVSGTETGYCGAASGTPSTTAKLGLRRESETVAGMGLLGLTWTQDPTTSDIFFLGYPNLQLSAIAAGSGSDNTGLGHTYGEDGDGLTSTCNGDFRYLLSGHHSLMKATDLKADLDSLLALTRPTDVYTLSEIDSHPDHATVSKQVWDAVRRSGLAPTMHEALIWPEGAPSLGCTIDEWPNPSLASVGGDPLARFTPGLSLAAPPYPRCTGATATNWGSWGAPDEVDPNPPAMQAPTEATNLKWQVISKYASQLRCGAGGDGTCGMTRAWVKKEEVFWRARFVVPPAPVLGAGSSYLSDLPWTSMTNGWGPLERDLSNGEQAQGDGQPLTLNGQAYAKGLGGHASSDVRFAIGGCTRFQASVGVDDEVGPNGSIDFQVFLDGVKAYDSGLMTGTSATKDIDLDTTGKSQLRLVIANGGDGIDYDHGDWAAAHVTCS